jgi:ADP-L-glycero-D-manno-heptose 6-epimerase
MKFFNVYGPNEYHKGRMASVILHAFKQVNETGGVKLFRSQRSGFADGMQLRDFVYVKDVAKAFLFAANSKNTGKGEILNIGSGKMTSMKKIAETIGGSVKFIPKRSFEVDAHLADLRFTKKTIKWKSRVNIIIWLKNFLSK